ncbi:Na+/H+ antiporter subunit D, partial [Vibrio diabolicus]
TVYSMTKIWSEAFWKKPVREKTEQTLQVKVHWLYCVPIAVLTMFTLIIGLVAEPFYQFSVQAAEQLLNPNEYIRAVLGGNP